MYFQLLVKKEERTDINRKSMESLRVVDQEDGGVLGSSWVSVSLHSGLVRGLLVLLLLITVPLSAQVREDNDADKGSTEVQFADSLVSDSTTLPWPQSVQVKLSGLLENDMFKTSQVGIQIYDLTADSVIFSHNERQLMRPASTEKVITAITALDRLGGDYQFKTELCYTGSVQNGTLTGDVYCVGGFDPKFGADDMKAFVEAIHKMGVDTIRGHLYADKSMKDFNTLGEGWCWDDDNPVLSPLLYGRSDKFMERFEQELRDAGIIVDAFSASGQKPQDAYCIVRRFHTIDQILLRMLKESDNLYAEAMFYQIAASRGERPASNKDASAVISQLVRKIGLDPARYNIADGSGLSLYNYVSAELEARMLRYAWKNRNIYLHLQPSLPEAGVDGTLRNRMKGQFTLGNVYAKTGTVTGISSLCGYCKAANGHELCFSIINQGLLHGRNGRNFQDKVCQVLCQP